MMGIKGEVMDAWTNTLSPLFTELSADVQVETLDEGQTVVDDLYDEPVETKSFKDPVTVKARVKIEKDRLVLPGGESKDVDGRMTFKTEELEEKGIDLDFGTRVTFADRKYVVIHIERTSQVEEEFLLTRVYLEES